MITLIRSNINRSSFQLNHDLSIMKSWIFLWKTCFNPDYIKQAKEMILYLVENSKTNPAGITYTKLTIEALEKGVKYVQS